MKNKVYTLYGKAVDKNGGIHYVTVVGVYQQKKEAVKEAIDTQLITDEGKTKNCTMIINHREKVRSITFGASICHPTDVFNEEIGISIAKGRAKSRPIGTVSTTNVTMLNDDACTALVFTELRHIINNIDDYIE